MKHMRSALFALLGALCFASPSIAQEAPPLPPIGAETTPEALAAGEDLYQAIVLDSGVLDGFVNLARTNLMPDLRASVVQSPLYLNAAPARREALLAVIDNVPNFIGREFERELVAMGARVAPRFAARMSAEHMTETATFLRSEVMQGPWRDFVAEIVSANPRASSFPEWRPVGTFADTEAGRAFAEQHERLGGILSEEMEETLILLLPRLRALAAGQICDALQDDCPTRVREEAGRI